MGSQTCSHDTQNRYDDESRLFQQNPVTEERDDAYEHEHARSVSIDHVPDDQTQDHCYHSAGDPTQEPKDACAGSG